MSTARTSAFALLLLCLVLAAGFPPRQAYKFCGRALADVLSLVCRNRGGLYSPRIDEETKRNEVFYRVGLYSSKRRGVADECCRRSCTFETLASYCALPFYVELPYDRLTDEVLLLLGRNRKLSETARPIPRNFKKTLSPTEKPEPRRKNLGYFVRNRPFIYVPRD